VVPGPEQPDGTQKFHVAAERDLTTNHLWTRHTLNGLSRLWPATVSLGEAVESLDGAEVGEIINIILTLFETGALELRVAPLPVAHEVSAKPKASRLAQAQLEAGHKAMTNARNAQIELANDLSRHLILLLDGTRDHQALAQELGGTDAIRAQLAPSLTGLARLCLLVE
jgi:hypothetical protein